MRHFTTFAIVLLTCALCAPAQAQPAPQATQQNIGTTPSFSPAHLEAVSQMLTNMRVGEVSLVGLRALKAKSPEQREFFVYLQTHLTKDDVVRAFTPAYARQIPIHEARELSALFERPQAQRAIGAQIELMGQPGQPRRLSEREARALVAAFDASGDGGRYTAVVKRGMGEANLALGRWLAQYHERLVGTPLQAIAADRAAWVASGMATEHVPFVPEKVGIGYIDEFATLVADGSNRGVYSAWKMQSGINALNAPGTMAPDQLLLPGNIARARALIDECEKSVETFLSESDANVAAFRAALDTARMPDAKVASGAFASTLEYHMGRSVKFAENQRAMLAQTRKVLDFVDARVQTITVKKGVFIFSSNAEADQFNALVADLRREVALSEAIWNETRTNVEQAAAAKP